MVTQYPPDLVPSLPVSGQTDIFISSNDFCLPQEATAELQKMAKTGRCCELFNLLLPMIFHTLWQDERKETMQKLIESVDAVIYKAGGKARPYIDKLLLVFQAGLCGTRQMKLIACRMVSKLTKVRHLGNIDYTTVQIIKYTLMVKCYK